MNRTKTFPKPLLWLVSTTLVLMGCASQPSEPWRPNQTQLQELEAIRLTGLIRADDTEAAAVSSLETSSSLMGSRTEALIFDAAGDEKSMKKRLPKYREAFIALRVQSALPENDWDAVNACFPKEFPTPNVDEVDPRQLFLNAHACRLVEVGHPMFDALRSDPDVSKHLDTDGKLITSADPAAMQKDLFDAVTRSLPDNPMRSVYPVADASVEDYGNRFWWVP